jgi:predicted nucleic acid-binding protein
MPSEIHDYQKYNFMGNDEVIVDANIWIYLYGPPGDEQKLNAPYSRLLEQILTRQCALVTASFVLSEFVNRYMRLGYGTWMERSSKNFKEYRLNSVGVATAKRASQSCQRILSQCARAIRQPISLDDLKADVATFATVPSDFTDVLIARVCRREKLILVTHDADFANYDGLTIVTANRKMLES